MITSKLMLSSFHNNIMWRLSNKKHLNQLGDIGGEPLFEKSMPLSTSWKFNLLNQTPTDTFHSRIGKSCRIYPRFHLLEFAPSLHILTFFTSACFIALFFTKLRDDSFEYQDIEWIITLSTYISTVACETSLLVGGWTNPSEKYARQVGSFSQRFGMGSHQNSTQPQNTPTFTAGFCIWCWNSSQFNVPGGLNNGFNVAAFHFNWNSSFERWWNTSVKHPKQNHLQHIQKRWGVLWFLQNLHHTLFQKKFTPPRFDINTKTDGLDCVSPCEYGNIVHHHPADWFDPTHCKPRAWAIHVGLLEKTFDLFRGVAKIIQISWQLNNGNEPGTPVGMVEMIEIR